MLVCLRRNLLEFGGMIIRKFCDGRLMLAWLVYGVGPKCHGLIDL